MDTDKSSMSDSSDQEMETGEFEGNNDWMDVDGEGDEGERRGRCCGLASPKPNFRVSTPIWT